MQMGAIQPILPTPEKKWYDRLADSILGDDPCKPHEFSAVSVDLTSLNSSSNSEQVRFSVREMFQA